MASKTTCLLLPFIFLSLSLVTPQQLERDEEHINCLNGNYTRGSLYDIDHVALLDNLSSTIGNSGFLNSSLGQAYAIALCRADINLTDCRRCVSSLAFTVRRQCWNRSQAIIWRQDCMVRYSNESISGKLANEPGDKYEQIGFVDSPREFEDAKAKLFDNLTTEAAGGGPFRKAAAGERYEPVNNETIYAMLQCTPDLSAVDCSACLVNAARYVSVCCGSTPGVIVFRPSCNLRYEVSPFYNLTRLQEPLGLSLPPSSSPSTAGTTHGNRTRNVIIIVLSIVVFLAIAFCLGIFVRKRMMQKATGHEIGEDGNEFRSLEFKRYNFHKIRAATNGFSEKNKLGFGGFGAVYKGKLKKGQEIAVKRLSSNPSGQGDPEFKTEALLLAKLQHKNLVRLLGFSLEGEERLLVYEFVQNGSLDNFIFDPIKSSDLKWETRYKIIRGVVEGLLHLHKVFRLPVIHRDLKASNVLLDEEMNPKISDFGLAKLAVQAHAHTSRVIGTDGYMAPEYVNEGELSTKSDVFSFGVLVLEIVTGQKVGSRSEGKPGNFLSRAWRSWTETKGASMIDTSLMVNSDDQQGILRCFHIALLCVQKNPSDRLEMDEVFQKLNDSSSTLQSPLEPGFYIPSDFYQAQVLDISSNEA